MSVYNIDSLIEILGRFSVQKVEINISFVFISMFTKVSNLIEKFEKFKHYPNEAIQKENVLNKEQKEFYKTDINKDEFFDKIWTAFFNNLVIICNFI